jgi:hypothetical protein
MENTGKGFYETMASHWNAFVDYVEDDHAYSVDIPYNGISSEYTLYFFDEWWDRGLMRVFLVMKGGYLSEQKWVFVFKDHRSAIAFKLEFCR